MSAPLVDVADGWEDDGVAGDVDGVPVVVAWLPADDAPVGALSAAIATAAVMPIVDTIKPDTNLLFSRRIIEGSSYVGQHGAAFEHEQRCKEHARTNVLICCLLIRRVGDGCASSM